MTDTQVSDNEETLVGEKLNVSVDESPESHGNDAGPGTSGNEDVLEEGNTSSPVISNPSSPIQSIGSGSSPDISPKSSRSPPLPFQFPDDSETHSPHSSHSPSDSQCIPPATSGSTNLPSSVLNHPISTDSLLSASASPVGLVHPSPKSSHMSIIIPATPHQDFRGNTALPESVLSRQSSLPSRQQTQPPQPSHGLSIKDVDAYLLSDDTEASIAVLQDSLAHLKSSPAHKNKSSYSSPYFSRNSPNLRQSPFPLHRLPLSAKSKPRFGPMDLFEDREDGGLDLPSKPWSQVNASPQKLFMSQGSGSSPAHAHGLGLQSPINESIRAGLIDPNDMSTLNKQVTGYRIQIKLLKQFIQKLLAAKPNMELPSDLENSFARLDRDDSQQEYQALLHDFNTLQETHGEVLELNEQMFTNLELFKDQLKQKELLLSKANAKLEEYTRNLNDLFRVSGSSQELELNLTQDDFNGDSSLEIDSKFKPLLHLLENSVSKQPGHLPSPPESRNQTESQESAHTQLIRVHELQQKVLMLEQELKRQTVANKSLETRLGNEINQAKSFEAKYSEMAEKFEEMCDELDPSEADAAIEALRMENDRLGNLNSDARSQFDECQKTIDQLQIEVNELKQSASTFTRHSTTRESDAAAHQQLAALSLEYEKSKETHQNTVTSLMSQLHRQKDQIELQNSQSRATEKVRHDMEIAVEKQRVYKSDNIRLGYKAESLLKEKKSLQLTVDKLTEQIRELKGFEGSQQTTTTTKLLYELFEIDIYEFQKLIQIFNKIADDESLKAPISKINKMSARLGTFAAEMPTPPDYSFLRECHRSVFEYFVRAVDMIVNDHIKMLLQENEEGFSNDDHIKNLRDQVGELLTVNESLSRKLDEYETRNEAFSSHESIPSPTIERLRILELQTRWKSEREARVYESNQADMRLREVEAENKRLRTLLEGA